MTIEQKKTEVAKNLLLGHFCETCFSYSEMNGRGTCTLKHNLQRRLYNTCYEFFLDVEIKTPLDFEDDE